MNYLNNKKNQYLRQFIEKFKNIIIKVKESFFRYIFIQTIIFFVCIFLPGNMILCDSYFSKFCWGTFSFSCGILFAKRFIISSWFEGWFGYSSVKDKGLSEVIKKVNEISSDITILKGATSESCRINTRNFGILDDAIQTRVEQSLAMLIVIKNDIDGLKTSENSINEGLKSTIEELRIRLNGLQTSQHEEVTRLAESLSHGIENLTSSVDNRELLDTLKQNVEALRNLSLDSNTRVDAIIDSTLHNSGELIRRSQSTVQSMGGLVDNIRSTRLNRSYVGSDISGVSSMIENRGIIANVTRSMHRSSSAPSMNINIGTLNVGSNSNGLGRVSGVVGTEVQNAISSSIGTVVDVLKSSF